MTHAQLVRRAGQWLRGMGCGLVFEELVALTGEIPDAIGWKDAGRISYLVECKASRGDFLADRKKPHRWDGAKAMGCYRYFMCPPGMIRPDELPERWGLLYCHASKVTIEAGRHPKRYDASMNSYYHRASRELELSMLYSALSRLRIDLGERRFHERVHLPYSERKATPPRRFVFLD